MSKAELLRWWRNWVALLTACCVGMLAIALLVGVPAWGVVLVGLGAINGSFQLASLTRRANTLDAARKNREVRA
jgi:hypothetical protein